MPLQARMTAKSPELKQENTENTEEMGSLGGAARRGEVGVWPWAQTWSPCFFPQVEGKLLQQVKGLQPGRAGCGLTSLQQRPSASWRPGAQQAKAEDLQRGVPMGARLPHTTGAPLECTAERQEPSGAGAEGVRAHTPEPDGQGHEPGVTRNEVRE